MEFRTTVSRLIVAFLIAFSFSVIASAATEVRLEPREVEAAKVLIKPEKTSLLLNERTGYFLPGSTIQFLGVSPSEFEIDLGSAGDLADVRFNRLEARGLDVDFEKDRIRVEIPFVDREKAIRTAVGAIHFRGVSLVVWLKAVETVSPYGGILLAVDATEVRGTMRGTGLIGAGTVDKIKAEIVKQTKKRVDEILAKPEVRENIDRGVVQYAKFSRDPALERYVPSSLAITEAGIVYQVE